MSVQAAWLRSCESGTWEDVVRLGERVMIDNKTKAGSS